MKRLNLLCLLFSFALQVQAQTQHGKATPPNLMLPDLKKLYAAYNSGYGPLDYPL